VLTLLLIQPLLLLVTVLLTTTLTSTNLLVGANVVVNSTTVFIGNSTVNAVSNSSGVYQNGQSSGGFPTGTQMLFVQNTAPTGWTKVTTFNDYSLRVVNGTSGGVGGGTTAFSTVFASRSISGTVGCTTLTVNQMPSHNHSGVLVSGIASGLSCAGGAAGGSTANTGGSQAHNHSLSITALDMAVKYVDVIIASKN
jgi:hypothetical protein